MESKQLLENFLYKKYSHTEMHLSEEDKVFYHNLIYQELVYSILPANEIESDHPLLLKKCDQCGVNHGNLPPVIYHRMQDLIKEL